MDTWFIFSTMTLSRHRQFYFEASRVNYRISQLFYIRSNQSINNLYLYTSTRVQQALVVSCPVTEGVHCVVTSSEVNRPDLHLCAFVGVVLAFPVEPAHAVSARWVFSMEVQAVQVRLVSRVVPPGAFVNHGTVPPIIFVVVSVFGAEGHLIVKPQGVTRCTCERNISPVPWWIVNAPNQSMRRCINVRFLRIFFPRNHIFCDVMRFLSVFSGNQSSQFQEWIGMPLCLWWLK